MIKWLPPVGGVFVAVTLGLTACVQGPEGQACNAGQCPSGRVCLVVGLPRARLSTSEGVDEQHRLDSHTQRPCSTTSGPCPGPGKRSGRTSSVARRTKISASCRRCCGRFLSLLSGCRPFSGERPCSANAPRCRDDHTNSSRAAGTPSPRRRRPSVFCGVRRFRLRLCLLAVRAI